MRLIATVFIIVFLCVTLMQSASSNECIKEFSWVAEDKIYKLASDDTPIMPGKIFIYVLNYNPFSDSTKNGILTRYIADSFLLKTTPRTGHPSDPNKFLINTICHQEIELNFSDIDSIWFYTNCSVNECDGVDIPRTEELTSIRWQFSRGDGSVISTDMYLKPDGTIAGYSNPNENRWRFEGNELLFYHEDGRVSTRFNTFKKDQGKWVISGPFQLWGAITHILTQLS